jgi:hypothetical protein
MKSYEDNLLSEMDMYYIDHPFDMDDLEYIYQEQIKWRKKQLNSESSDTIELMKSKSDIKYN